MWELDGSDAENPDRYSNLSSEQFRRVVSTPDNWVGPIADEHMRDTGAASSLPDEQVVSRYRRSYNKLLSAQPGTPEEDSWAGVSDTWYGETKRRGISGREMMTTPVPDQAAKYRHWPDPQAQGVVRGRHN